MHERIGRRDLAVGPRQIQHVDLAHDLLAADGHVVAEPAVERPRVQRRCACARRRSGAALPRSGRRRTPCCGRSGPALAGAELVQPHVVLRLAVALVEPVVRVQALVAEVLVGAAGEPVGARARDEVDRRRRRDRRLRRRRPPSSRSPPRPHPGAAAPARRTRRVFLLNVSLLLTPSSVMLRNDSGRPLTVDPRMPPEVLTPTRNVTAFSALRVGVGMAAI